MLTKKVVNDVKSVVGLCLIVGSLILLVFGALPLVTNAEDISDENIKLEKWIEKAFFQEAYASDGSDNNMFSSGFGDGSSENPFVLSNGDDLARFSELANGENKEEFLNKAYILNKDINMNGKSWFPIGNSNIGFSGVFDGNGYTISNMECNSSGFCSVFGYLVNNEDSSMVDSGTIENVVIRNCDFSSENVTSGLVAIAFQNTNIFNCKVYSGKLVGKKVGGIVGSVDGEANIQNCCSEENELSTLESDETMYIGGIASLNKEGFFVYSYAANNIYNTKGNTVIGGFTGGNRNYLGINAYCCFIYDDTVAEGKSSKAEYASMFEPNYGQCYYYCNGDSIDGEDSTLKEDFINNVVLTGVNSDDGPFYQGSRYPEIDYTYHMETGADRDTDEEDQGNNSGDSPNNSDENNENSDENEENNNNNDSNNEENNENDNKESSQSSNRCRTFYDIYTLEKPKNTKWQGNKCVWDKVEFADYYYVSKYRNGNKEGRTKKVYINEISFKSLKKSGRYKFVVVASSDNNLIADSIPAWSKSRIYQPKAVKVVKATKTNNSVTLFWSRVDNIQGYRIYMKKDNKYVMHICYLKPNTLSKTIGNLDGEHSYYFKVKAVNGGLFSFSKIKKATTVI